MEVVQMTKITKNGETVGDSDVDHSSNDGEKDSNGDESNPMNQIIPTMISDTEDGASNQDGLASNQEETSDTNDANPQGG